MKKRPNRTDGGLVLKGKKRAMRKIQFDRKRVECERNEKTRARGVSQSSRKFNFSLLFPPWLTCRIPGERRSRNGTRRRGTGLFARCRGSRRVFNRAECASPVYVAGWRGGVVVARGRRLGARKRPISKSAAEKTRRFSRSLASSGLASLTSGALDAFPRVPRPCLKTITITLSV